MDNGPTGSTVPRRQLGRNLRDLRNQARMTVRSAARRLEWSEAKMWRIETGQTSLRSLDVEAMCKVAFITEFSACSRSVLGLFWIIESAPIGC